MSATRLEGRLLERFAQGGIALAPPLATGIASVVEEVSDAALNRWFDDVLGGSTPVHTYFEFEDEVLSRLDLVGYALIECERLGIRLPSGVVSRITDLPACLSRCLDQILTEFSRIGELTAYDWSWRPKSFWWRHLPK